jgi:hypothetical protein
VIRHSLVNIHLITRHIIEDSNLHSHRSENLRPHTFHVRFVLGKCFSVKFWFELPVMALHKDMRCGTGSLTQHIVTTSILTTDISPRLELSFCKQLHLYIFNCHYHNQLQGSDPKGYSVLTDISFTHLSFHRVPKLLSSSRTTI